MRKIRGQIKNQGVSWRIGTNEEIDLLFKHSVRYTKAQRIRWVEHIVRMDIERTVKRITEWRPSAVGRIGRPRLRCMMPERIWEK